MVDVSPDLLQALLVYRRVLRSFALKKGRPASTIMFPAVGSVDRLDDSNVRKVFADLHRSQGASAVAARSAGHVR